MPIQTSLFIIDRLDDWTHRLAAPVLPFQEVVEAGSGRRGYVFQHTEQLLIIGKIVRAVSGLHAALALAERGWLMECVAILRMVHEFCEEVGAVLESIRGGTRTAAVTRFIQQYFAPKARTPDEFAGQKRGRWVSREELMTYHVRMANGTGIDPEEIRKALRFVNMIGEAAVHGSFETAIELYDSGTNTFATKGASEHVDLALTNVAGKLTRRCDGHRTRRVDFWRTPFRRSA
jgi:hypothetical protein